MAATSFDAFLSHNSADKPSVRGIRDRLAKRGLRCWFDEGKCLSGIKALEGYRRQWNENQGCWSSKPHHDKFSHGADSFRMMAVGLNRVEKSNAAIDGRTLGHASLKQQAGSQYSGSTPILNSNTYDPRECKIEHQKRIF